MAVKESVRVDAQRRRGELAAGIHKWQIRKAKAQAEVAKYTNLIDGAEKLIADYESGIADPTPAEPEV